MTFQRWTAQAEAARDDQVGLVRVMIHLYDPTATRAGKRGQHFSGQIKSGAKGKVLFVNQASISDVVRAVETALFGEGQ